MSPEAWVSRSRKVISRNALTVYDYAAGIEYRDALVGELRQKPADRVVELESPFLVKHHNGHGGDRFGHRINAEDGVRRHRFSLFFVREPTHSPMRHLSPPCHHGRDTSELAVSNQLVAPGVDARQPFAAQPDILRARNDARIFHRSFLRMAMQGRCDRVRGRSNNRLSHCGCPSRDSSRLTDDPEHGNRLVPDRFKHCAELLVSFDRANL